MYNYSELNEIADGMGTLTRAVSFAEAMILAKRVLPDETHTVISNLADQIRRKSLRDAIIG